MITAKTHDGFTVALDENVLDYRLLEEVSKLPTDGMKLFGVVDRFLGQENKERLLEHLADESGRVPLEAVGNAINELMTSFQAGKNSASSPA